MCESCKLLVLELVSLTFDGSHANCNTFTHLLCRLDAVNVQCSFTHPEDENQQIVTFFDACNMLKLMRNMLADGS